MTGCAPGGRTRCRIPIGSTCSSRRPSGPSWVPACSVGWNNRTCSGRAVGNAVSSTTSVPRPLSADLLGGLFAVEGTKRLIGQRRRTGDVYVFPLIAATILGRVGCFLMGVGEPTHGLPTDSWLGIDLGDGIPRHPTALYEIVFLLLLAGGLSWIKLHLRPRPGRLFAAYLSAYLVYRLVVGFSQPAIRFAGLGVIQWACVVGICWYLVEHYRMSNQTT